MKKTGGFLLAATVGSSLALSTLRAHAAQSALAQNKQTQDATTPQKALQMLKDGNARFVQGEMLKRNLMQQVKATGGGQFPFAVIVGCIGSRVPIELIFDQGMVDKGQISLAGAKYDVHNGKVTFM
jgi:carbonic anhydrase